MRDILDRTTKDGRTNRNPGRVISSLELILAKQLEMKGISGWGGKRRGAGRPNKSGLVSHGARERVNFKAPLHLTLKIRKGIPSIRSKTVLKVFKDCCAKAKRFDFHVLHFSLQSNHAHLVVEAADNEALRSGMQSLTISFAKRVKALMQTWKGAGEIAGGIFAGRFHLEKLTCPTKTRNALRYVLLNSSKHEDLIEYVDEFCSGFVFAHWKELLKSQYRGLIKRQTTDLVIAPEKWGLSPPRSWLARVGWMRAV